MNIVLIFSTIVCIDLIETLKCQLRFSQQDLFVISCLTMELSPAVLVADQKLTCFVYFEEEKKILL